jgi:hypothetical protein
MSTQAMPKDMARDTARNVRDLTCHVAKVFMSRYLGVRTPTAAQLDFLMATEREVLYAGTGSSGKSTAVLMAALINAELPGYAGLVVVPELANSAIVAMTREWLRERDARWDAGTRCWRFPNGASLSVVHRRASISGGYQFIGVDDVARLEREEYVRLLARLRRSEATSVPPALRVAGSPDEPGREWITDRFRLGDGADDALVEGRRVIQASFEDEGLNVDPDRVRQGLSELPEPRRTWLLHGEWGVRTPIRAEPEPPYRQPLAAGGGIERARAHLGNASPGEEEVWFDPYLQGAELPNPHVLVTGETGAGKTQALQSVTAQLAAHAILPLVLDFKSDYDGEWAADRGVRVIDPAGGDKLPFNPLAPVTDQKTGETSGLRQLHLVADLLKRVWGLGDQQAYRLREAIKEAYAGSGVPLTTFRPTIEQVYPTFDDVRHHLEPEDTVLGRLSPLFDLDPFGSDHEGLAEMISDGVVVRLSQLPGGESKTAIAEFLLLALYDHLVRQGHQRRLTRLLVMDEGWRLATCPFLEPLLREGRAFGLGVILASQYPADLPQVIRGAAATQLHFGQSQAGQAGDVRRAVLGDSRGRQAQQLEDAVRGLRTFHAVLCDRQHSPWQEIRVTPYFERRGGG